MNKTVAGIIIVLLISGCASSTGVVSTGDNEFMISETDMGDVWHTGDNVLAKLYT